MVTGQGQGDGGGGVQTLIDCHAHVFDADMPTCPTAWTVPDYAFTPDDLLAQMDAHGVQHAVLSGLSISGGYNDYMLRALRAHPGRLRGTAIVDPPSDFYAMERMTGEGITGIRLQLARSDQLPDLTTMEYRMLLRRVRDFGWHVQVAIEGPRLRQVLEPLMAAQVNVVIDHFGHPDPADPLACDGMAALMTAVDTGRCWVKLSGGFRLAGTSAWAEEPDGELWDIADRVAPWLLARVGTDRLLWGSDAPFVGYEGRVSYAEVIAKFRSWVPDAAKRAEIGQTGKALFFG